MGLLLMQYEYQLANAKKSMYEHRGILLNNKQEMYNRRIENITKLFAKRDTQIDSKYSSRLSNLQSQLTAARGFGGTAGLANIISVVTTGDYANTFANFGVTEATITQAFDVYTKKSAQSKAASDVSLTTDLDNSTAASSALTSICSTIQSVLQQVVDALKEMEHEELEATKEAQLAPLKDKDAEIQAEISSNDTLTELADQRAEKAKARLGKDAPNAVAHYGLQG